jgi:hypothetical protein
MRKITILLTVLPVLIAAGAATAGLDKHLEVFEPYVGKTLEDGRVHLKSEFLQDGEWVPGHVIYYVEAPDAKVVFK